MRLEKCGVAADQMRGVGELPRIEQTAGHPSSFESVCSTAAWRPACGAMAALPRHKTCFACAGGVDQGSLLSVGSSSASEDHSKSSLSEVFNDMEPLHQGQLQGIGKVEFTIFKVSVRLVQCLAGRFAMPRWAPRCEE